jgi:hypothetical protein
MSGNDLGTLAPGPTLPPAYRETDARRAVRVLDPEKNPITLATLIDIRGRLCFRETRATRGRLTAYFFLDGRRSVLLDLGRTTVQGSLVTFWNGRERLWQLRPAE